MVVSGPWKGVCLLNRCETPPVDNAVFISETNRIPDNVASAALEAGLPASSVDDFVEYIVAQNKSAVASVPGATPAIITAGTSAVLDTYTVAFRYVWLSAIPFLVVATVGTYPCCLQAAPMYVEYRLGLIYLLQLLRF